MSRECDELAPEAGESPEAAEAVNEEAEGSESTSVARYIATAARAVAGHTGPGLRHAWQLTAQWATAGYISDDEIRRRLVKKHLDKYIDQRDEVAMHVRRLGKKTAKRSQDAAHFGFTQQEATQLKDMAAELSRYHTAGKTLSGIEFNKETVQPTPGQIKRVRALRGLLRFSGVVLPVAGAAVAALIAWPLTGAFALPILAGGAWWLGRHPIAMTTRPLHPDLMAPELEPVDGPDGPAEAPDADTAPYPIGKAETPAEAEEALRRALLAQGQNVANVSRGCEESWGWSAYVRYRSGSPDDINKNDVYKGMITTLKLRRNGLLIEGDPESGDAAYVRMIQRDPFTPESVGSVRYRAPLSMSIQDTADYGKAMDATPLTFALAGLMLLMVADSGGGKSGIMLALAEVVTACTDAVAVNLDPVGTGVGALGPAITLDASMDDEMICAVLEFLLSLCTARAKQRMRYKWGNKWKVCPEHPALCVFVDEWPQLSAKAKERLIKLLLLGRKEAIWVYGGSQFGTSTYLGEAIGPKLSAKLLGSCRRVDITELLGGGAVAEGYRADLIRAATHTEKNDAGQIYAQGLPGMPDKPMRYQIREISEEYAATVAEERVNAGLPDVTHTLTEAGMIDEWRELQKAARAAHGESEPPPSILADIRQAFTAEGDPDALTVDQLHRYLRQGNPDLWDQWEGRKDRMNRIGEQLRRELQAVGSLRTRRITAAKNRAGLYLADVEEVLTAWR